MNVPTPKAVLARDFMATKLVTLRPEMDALEAIRQLLAHRISGAPVIDEGPRYVGVFSEKSCMQLLVDAAYEQMPSSLVGHFMNTDPGRTIQADTPFLNVVQMFLNTPYRRLPVLEGNKLVGQISRRDVLREAMKQIEIAPKRENSLLYLSALFERENAPVE
jgi:predicted transcriptional regulator